MEEIIFIRENEVSKLFWVVYSEVESRVESKEKKKNKIKWWN